MAKRSFIQKTLHASTNIGTRSAVLLARPWVRPLLIVIALCVSFWFLYRYAVTPFRQDLVLPAGVTPNNPQLQGSILNRMNKDRSERASHRIPAFSSVRVYFAPVSTPEPR